MSSQEGYISWLEHQVCYDVRSEHGQMQHNQRLEREFETQDVSGDMLLGRFAAEFQF